MKTQDLRTFLTMIDEWQQVAGEVKPNDYALNTALADAYNFIEAILFGKRTATESEIRGEMKFLYKYVGSEILLSK